MSAQLISGLAGSALSLVFSYVPGAATWFDTLTPTQRRLFMAALMLVVAGASLAWTCRIATACLLASWQDYVTAYAAALVANQTTFAVSPQPAPKVALVAPERKAT